MNSYANSSANCYVNPLYPAPVPPKTGVCVSVQCPGQDKLTGGWGLFVMRLFKTVWCSRKRRAGHFNVYQANHKNHTHITHLHHPGCIGGHALDKANGGTRRSSSSDSDLFIKNSDLSGCCRSPVDRRCSPTGSIVSSQSQLTPSRQLSDGERLKKTVLELVDTERAYVKHLNNLLENYLEPLKNATFLSSAEVTALFGNIREIVAFQRLFLQALQDALDMEPAFNKFEHPFEFKNVLFSIGSAFLYYASQFKLYSSFCASHSKAQKVLHPSEGNQALQEFLMARNPRQQHSSTLESYLIKPIQRILKYPLLLQQMKVLTEPGSDEHRHLGEALKVMEKVAEHINEMQRIHEEYGAIFDHLFRQHQKSCKQVGCTQIVTSSSLFKQPIDLSPGDLLYYGGVEWLNISDFLGKIKKGLELHAMCFVFKTAVVFLCKERLRQKKKLMGVPGKNSSSEVEIIRYQVLIPVTEVQVRASSMKDMDNHFLWELIHLKSQLQRRSEKVYHLSNSTSEFRNAFLKTIRQIIRESVRNMNIPANKPGSSSGSSGTGGGGSGGSSTGSGRTNTLQPSRSGGGKKKSSQNQSSTLQRHSAGNIDYDNLESYDNVPETQHVDDSAFRSRSKTVSDAMDELSDSTTKSDCGKDEYGLRSEGEEEVITTKKPSLGRTPNHLSLSTTSTLSTGSTSSQARLIQASNQPHNYQPTKSVDRSFKMNGCVKNSHWRPSTTTVTANAVAVSATTTTPSVTAFSNQSRPPLPGNTSGRSATCFPLYSPSTKHIVSKLSGSGVPSRSAANKHNFYIPRPHGAHDFKRSSSYSLRENPSVNSYKRSHSLSAYSDDEFGNYDIPSPSCYTSTTVSSSSTFSVSTTSTLESSKLDNDCHTPLIPRISYTNALSTPKTTVAYRRNKISTVTTQMGFIPRVMSTVNFSSSSPYSTTTSVTRSSKTSSIKALISCPLNSTSQNNVADIRRQSKGPLSSPTPYFPVDNGTSYDRKSVPTGSSKIDSLDSSGITIDTLLQQLRALS